MFQDWNRWVEIWNLRDTTERKAWFLRALRRLESRRFSSNARNNSQLFHLLSTNVHNLREVVVLITKINPISPIWWCWRIRRGQSTYSSDKLLRQPETGLFRINLILRANQWMFCLSKMVQFRFKWVVQAHLTKSNLIRRKVEIMLHKFNLRVLCRRISKQNWAR